MTEQTTQQINVADMLRITGENTSEFLKQVAAHIDNLEQTIVTLENRLQELEAKNGTNDQTAG